LQARPSFNIASHAVASSNAPEFLPAAWIIGIVAKWEKPPRIGL